MLPEDERKEGQLKRMPFALDQAKPVLADIWVLRSVGYEALFRQFQREVMVSAFRGLWRRHVGSTPFEPMLANHHGAPFARPDIFRNQQNAVGEHTGPDIQHHLVSAKLWLIVNQPRTWMGGQRRRGQTADHLIPDVVAVKACGLSPPLRR